MSIQSSSQTAGAGAAITLVATLISVYIVSQFLRNSIGVIAPNLAQELGLSPGEIGLLSSVFFLVFAAVQIPVGVALDRFGPRLCLIVGTAVTVVGAVVFAAAAMQIGFGTLGALLATAPLAFSTATIGWRGSFLAVGACTALIGLLIAVVVKDDGRARGRHETLRESWYGIAAVLRTPSVGRLFVMNLVMYSTFGLIVGLWGGPYLTHIYGYSLEARGSFLLIPVLTQILGSMLWGPMDRLTGSHKLPVLVGAGATAAALGYLALAGTLTPVMLVTWFALFGLVSAFGPVLIAHGRALFSLHQVGRGLTVLNMGSMGGVFLSQAVSGFVIEWFPVAADGAYALSAYRAVFGLQAAFILLVSLVYFRARDPKEQPRKEPGPLFPA